MCMPQESRVEALHSTGLSLSHLCSLLDPERSAQLSVTPETTFPLPIFERRCVNVTHNGTAAGGEVRVGR